MASDQPAQPPSTRQPSSTSQSVSVSPQGYLDSSCHVKGSQLLSIEPNVVVHPRCRFYTDQGTITVKQGTILNERCILGSDKESPPKHSPSNPITQQDKLSPVGKDNSPALTTSTHNRTNHDISIGPHANLHSAVRIHPPCNIGDSVILEAGVSILPNCTIAAHSKICAGVTLPPNTTIPEWTVVYGMQGQMRRRRQTDAAEDARLDAMGKERAGIELLLKSSATKISSSAAPPSRDKRASVVRGDSTKV